MVSFDLAGGVDAPAGATRVLTLTLPLPDRRLCGNGTAGKFARGRLVKAARLATYHAGLARRGELGLLTGDFVWETGRVRLDALVRRDPTWAARRLDDDNFWRGMKATIDGLQDAGFVMDDRQFALGTVVWVTGEPWRGSVLLTLTEVGS
jgi:hypothetical protein